jgi:hypothetical protein
MADASVLSMDDIRGLLSDSRTKGSGTEVLQSFLESEEPGIEVDLSNGPLAGKDPGKAHTTLMNARKRTVTAPDGSPVAANPEFGKIKIIKRNVGTKESPEYHVFLINTDLVEV